MSPRDPAPDVAPDLACESAPASTPRSAAGATLPKTLPSAVHAPTPAGHFAPPSAEPPALETDALETDALETEALETDALVIGAGPVGLFQVFQLGLQGVACHLVDALPHLGGQCAQLYADKPIYDIPGIVHCTGRELIERLQQQMAPFAPTLHLGQQVCSLQATADGRWAVRSESTATASPGPIWIAKTVFIAAGVGAFVPRSLPLPGLTACLQRQAWFASNPPPADTFTGQQVLVCGDSDSALHACLQAVSAGAARVTLLHRREQFQAEPPLLAAFAAARASGHIGFVAAQPLALHCQDGRLQGLQVLDAQGQEQRLACDHLVMALGLSPKLGPLADWGLDIERKQLQVRPDTFATSAAGIFAVGDINTYAGKKKLIVCGFHEATLAAFAAAACLWPEQKTLLQYTTTSSLLHQRLGLA